MKLEGRGKMHVLKFAMKLEGSAKLQDLKFAMKLEGSAKLQDLKFAMKLEENKGSQRSHKVESFSSGTGSLLQVV